MRVLVTSDTIGALDTIQAGSALGRAWAERGAQVAVAPMGEAGAGFAEALAAAAGVAPGVVTAELAGAVGVCVVAGGDLVVGLDGGREAVGIERDRSSAPLGEALREALRGTAPERIYLDLSWARGTHDAGAGLLAALGATADGDLGSGLAGLDGVTTVDLAPVRQLLGDADLIGVVPAAELGKPLLGLRGISATRGFAAEVPLEDTMAADAVVEGFVRAVTGEVGEHAGACGGAAFAVLALGGRIASGVAVCAERVGLADTLRQCDLVVSGCDHFDFHTRGGGVVEYVAERAAVAGAPLVVVANSRMIGNREMRTFGVEAAYALELTDPTPAAVTEASADIARTWSW